MFAKNVAYSNVTHKAARSYCKNHSDKAGYDECMDKEYFCALEVATITGADSQTKAETREANRKATAILKKNNVFKKFF